MAKQRRGSRSAVRQARLTGAVGIYGDRGQDCAFISQKDFGELLLRIMDSWPDTYDEIDVPPADVMKFDEFASLLKEEFPTVRISYVVSPLSADVNFSDDAVRREYDWIPLLSLRDELKEVAEFQERGTDGEKRSSGEKYGSF